MEGMMELIRDHKPEPGHCRCVMVPPLMVTCIDCECEFPLDRHDFCPYCFTDSTETWLKNVIGGGDGA